MMHSLMTSVVLFLEDVRSLLLMIFILLFDDVDKVSEVDGVDILNPFTVLDGQGDVGANLCDLL